MALRNLARTGAGLACALVLGAAPAVAYADFTSAVAEDASRAVAEFESTGNPSALGSAGASSAGEGISLLSATYPEKFDLRHVTEADAAYTELAPGNYVTPVKLQNPWGTCWGFGGIAASETSLISELTSLGYTLDEIKDMGVYDLSELHLAYFTYTALPEDDFSGQGGEGSYMVGDQNPLDVGGNQYNVTSVLASGIGPVEEAYVPYRNKEGIATGRDENGEVFTEVYDTLEADLKERAVSWASTGDWSVEESKRFEQLVQLESGNILPTPITREVQSDGTYAFSYNQEGVDAIKSELLAGRGVEIFYTADQSKPADAVGNVQSKYMSSSYAQYVYEFVSPNHLVEIVGWDDTYAKENFAEGFSDESKAQHTPEGDGAWIVKNSWGSSDQTFPNKLNWGIDEDGDGQGEGYFYLSYYDRSLYCAESFDFDVTWLTQGDETADYSLVDQYDYMPDSGASEVESSQSAAYMANVFTAEEDMKLQAVSCDTANDQTSVTYQVYLLEDGWENPMDGELLAELTTTYTYKGFHRETLQMPLPLHEGEQFSVVVSEKDEDGYVMLINRAVSEAGAEYVNEQSQATVVTSYARSVVNEGESFVFEDGAWRDLTALIAEIHAKLAAQQQDLFEYDNFSIKAYSEPYVFPQITVPDVTGMTEAEAREALLQAGFAVKLADDVYSDTIASGCVVSQSPAGGSAAEEGSTVTLSISKGKAPTKQTASGSTTPTSGEASGNGGAKKQARGMLPATGDNASVAAAGALALASACIAIGLKRKRKETEHREVR